MSVNRRVTDSSELYNKTDPLLAYCSGLFSYTVQRNRLLFNSAKTNDSLKSIPDTVSR